VRTSARAIGILVLLLSICGVSAARCQSLEPDDVVRILYNTSNTYEPPFVHWSRKMRRLWAAELQWMDASFCAEGSKFGRRNGAMSASGHSRRFRNAPDESGPFR